MGVVADKNDTEKDKNDTEKDKSNMNKQFKAVAEQEQWRINLNELRKKTGKTYSQIAEEENLSEKSVGRVFTGEAKSPGVDLVRRIIHALGGTWREIFAESEAFIGAQGLATLQAEVDRLNAEMGVLRAENNILNDKITVLTRENSLLQMKLDHKEELLAVHNYYINLIKNKPTD